MKEKLVLLATLAFVVCGCQESVKYDAADPIYKFIPLADKSWTDRFGDTDDTRMKHSMSELRVVVAAQGQQLKALKAFVTKIHDPNMFDPNEVTK